MCCIFSEKQACIRRELFENAFVQVVLSLSPSVKSIFSVNKQYKAVMASHWHLISTIQDWRGLEMILLHSVIDIKVITVGYQIENVP